MIALLFAALGITTGFGQASLLARAATGTPNPLSFFARLSAVTLVLVVSVRAGYLGFAAAGWFAGFALSTFLAYQRLRSPRRGASK